MRKTYVMRGNRLVTKHAAIALDDYSSDHAEIVTKWAAIALIALLFAMIGATAYVATIGKL